MPRFTTKIYFKLNTTSVLLDRSEQRLSVKGRCTIEAPIMLGDVFAIELVKDELILTKQP